MALDKALATTTNATDLLTRAGKAKSSEEIRTIVTDAGKEQLSALEEEKKAALEKPTKEAQAKGEYALKEAKKYEEADVARKMALEAAPLPEFRPNEDTLIGMATLGSLVAVLGQVLGKTGGEQSALGAIESMSGMMAGYQQGKKDYIKQQQLQFDKNFQVMKAKQEQIQKEFEAAIKKMPYDLAGARVDMEVAIAKLGSPTIEATYRKRGAELTYKMIMDIANSIKEAERLASKSGVGKISEKLEKEVGDNVNLMQGLADLSKMVDMVKDEPFVFGIISGNLPLSMVQYVQSEAAKQTISLLQNITSKELKLRSGATVTVQEFARSRGFLPVRDDNASTLQSKIRGLFDAINSETEGFAESKRLSEELRDRMKTMPQPLAPSIRQQAKAIPSTSAIPDQTLTPEEQAELDQLRERHGRPKS